MAKNSQKLDFVRFWPFFGWVKLMWLFALPVVYLQFFVLWHQLFSFLPKTFTQRPFLGSRWQVAAPCHFLLCRTRRLSTFARRWSMVRFPSLRRHSGTPQRVRIYPADRSALTALYTSQLYCFFFTLTYLVTPSSGSCDMDPSLPIRLARVATLDFSLHPSASID